MIALILLSMNLLAGCREDCDRDLENRQNIAEANYDLTVTACAGSNIGACIGCLFLTAFPAVLACYISCGIILPTFCANTIETAWHRYLEELAAAGDVWVECLNNCNTKACI
jgi:hypothetical protein